MASNRRPRPRITRWMRIKRYIYTFESPLRLRSSLTRLRHHNKHPWLALARLFHPLPTWHFHPDDPVPFSVMLDNYSLWESRADAADLRNMRAIPLWRARDTPLRSLYRIYEAMAARYHIPIAAEVEYFWYQNRRSWEVHRIPDPCDPDPVRYAILACIAEELANAFDWRLSVGLRRDHNHVLRETADDELPEFMPVTAPAWVKKVPALDFDLIGDLPSGILNSLGSLELEKDGDSRVFAERNIVVDTGYFYTV